MIEIDADIEETGFIDESEKEKKEYVVDKSDNSYFPDIQVDDIRTIITPDCVGVFDFDMTVYKACSAQEVNYINIKNEEFGIDEDLKKVTDFVGRGKGIKSGSWLYSYNLEQEVNGGIPLSEEDFEITHKQKLLYSHEKAIKGAKVSIYSKLKILREQYRVPRIKVIIGEGECFRNELDLCKPYKGNRKDTLRPLILEEIRKWVLEELDAELAEDTPSGKHVEADDVVEYYGLKGYMNYRKTGKFNYLVIASDKDSKNMPKLLIDPDTYVGKDNPKRGKFKFPKAMLIEASDRDVGDVVPATSDGYKFYGFKGLLWQAFLSGDGADNYNCLSHLSLKSKFGDEHAYRVIKPCKTAKESLQKTIDALYSVLPYGVKYTTHKGEELDVDTMTYMCTYFLVAYMRRSPTDETDFNKLCKMIGVDTSKIMNNHLYTPPMLEYQGDEDHILWLKGILSSMLNDELKGYKSLKKAELVDRLDTVKSLLECVEFDSHYITRQYRKEGVEEINWE